METGLILNESKSRGLKIHLHRQLNSLDCVKYLDGMLDEKICYNCCCWKCTLATINNQLVIVSDCLVWNLISQQHPRIFLENEEGATVTVNDEHCRVIFTNWFFVEAENLWYLVSTKRCNVPYMWIGNLGPVIWRRWTICLGRQWKIKYVKWD